MASSRAASSGARRRPARRARARARTARRDAVQTARRSARSLSPGGSVPVAARHSAQTAKSRISESAPRLVPSAAEAVGIVFLEIASRKSNEKKIDYMLTVLSARCRTPRDNAPTPRRSRGSRKGGTAKRRERPNAARALVPRHVHAACTRSSHTPHLLLSPRGGGVLTCSLCGRSPMRAAHANRPSARACRQRRAVSAAQRPNAAARLADARARARAMKAPVRCS